MIYHNFFIGWRLYSATRGRIHICICEGSWPHGTQFPAQEIVGSLLLVPKRRAPTCSFTMAAIRRACFMQKLWLHKSTTKREIQITLYGQPPECSTLVSSPTQVCFYLNKISVAFPENNVIFVLIQSQRYHFIEY